MDIETITATPPADAGGSGDAQPKTETKTDGAGVQKPGETKQESAERKWKLKYGKIEREVDERELVANAQKGLASDEKFKQAKAIERQIKDALEKGDLDSLIQKMKGKSKVDFARDVLREELRKMQMTPEEKDAAESKEAVDRLKKERADLEALKESEQRDARQRHYEEQYDRELSGAVEKHKIPKNKYVIGRAIKIAQEIVDMNLEPDWDLVVGEAKRQWQGEMYEMIDNMDDFGDLGEDRARKISKWLVSKGMTRKDADKEAVKVVKQQDQKPDTEPVDADSYFEKKRALWSK